MVSNMFYFHRYLRRWSNLTNIFNQNSSKHQLVVVCLHWNEKTVCQSFMKKSRNNIPGYSLFECETATWLVSWQKHQAGQDSWAFPEWKQLAWRWPSQLKDSHDGNSQDMKCFWNSHNRYVGEIFFCIFKWIQTNRLDTGRTSLHSFFGTFFSATSLAFECFMP